MHYCALYSHKRTSHTDSVYCVTFTLPSLLHFVCVFLKNVFNSLVFRNRTPEKYASSSEDEGEESDENAERMLSIRKLIENI